MLPTPTLVMGIVQRTLGKWLYVSDESKDQLLRIQATSDSRNHLIIDQYCK